jgi:FixJ family two-component response regulator
VIYLGPPADEHGAERAAGIVCGLADGAEKALGAMLDFAADFIAPPPPTKEQAERMQRATEEQRERNAAAAPEQEKDAQLQELLDQIRRDDHRARYDRYTGRNLDDDDHERGRERERDRGY